MEFFQMPRFLFDSPVYCSLSSNAKLMYMFILDRYRLSRKLFESGDSTYYDGERGDCFVYFSNADLMRLLGIRSKATMSSVKQELVSCGLVLYVSGSPSGRFFVGRPKGNVVRIDNRSTSVVDSPQAEESVSVSTDVIKGLAEKWEARDGCDVCDRLLEYFARSRVSHEITAKEFWYIRNSIQRYESSGKFIYSFSDFVKGIRKTYRKTGYLVRVDVGANTDIDVSNKLKAAYSKPMSSSDDDILKYDWLEL